MKLFKLVRKWQTDEGEGSIDPLFIFADDAAEAILIASAETH